MTVWQNIYSSYSDIPIFHFQIILSKITKKPPEFLLAHPEFPLTAYQIKQLQQLLEKYRDGWPLAYLIGEKEFFGLKFKVNQHTLIPRPETEHLVEMGQTIIKEANRKQQPLIILDLGTGSGNIIISLAKFYQHYHHLFWFASDYSSAALSVATKNASFQQVHQITFLQGNLLRPFQKYLNYLKKTTPATSNISFNIDKTVYQENKKQAQLLSSLSAPVHLLIVANLPYLSASLYKQAPRNVKNFEPKEALLSGTDGLDHYRRLWRQLAKIKALIPDFSPQKRTLLFEISPEQKSLIEKELPTFLPNASLSFFRDLAQKWRVGKIDL